MLTFYRNTSDRFSEQIITKLQEMVVAHKVIDVRPTTTLPDGIDKNDLPVLTDGHEHWASDEIKDFLERLHQDLQLSRSMQSDACYLDPDNPDDCL